MKDHFYKLFSFNYWANKVIADYLSINQIQDDDCMKIMSHLFHAQSNWYRRIIGQQNDQQVWKILELSELSVLLEDNGTLWLEHIRVVDQNHLSESIAYNNLAGEPFQNTLQDIFAHVVNHASYHRGQIIRRIREMGHIPPSTDYIQYARIFPVDNSDSAQS